MGSNTPAAEQASRNEATGATSLAASIEVASTPISSETDTVAAAAAQSISPKGGPLVLLTIGMAGSGKSTFMQRLNSHLHRIQKRPYIVNLDPAVRECRFGVNIDIRDTVDYQEVMKEYSLGPNGGILTALNLFTTKFDEVIELIDKKRDQYEYILIDTPGQIEIFTWSASGQIITESLASRFPTAILYIIDTPRCKNPVTFMSNMLYAVSILYKLKLPFLVVFNKTDVTPHQFALDWMADFETFLEAVNEAERASPRGSSYSSSLVHSMALVLDEFYRCLKTCGVSSITGEGLDDFLTAAGHAKMEYMDEYLPELQRVVQQKKADLAEKDSNGITNMLKDMKILDTAQ